MAMKESTDRQKSFMVLYSAVKENLPEVLEDLRKLFASISGLESTRDLAALPEELLELLRLLLERMVYAEDQKTLREILLRDQGIDYREIDVSRDTAGLEEMVARSNRRSVPQIFFGEEHIGGFEDLVEYFKLQREAEVAA